MQQFTPDDNQRQLVRAMAGYGVSASDIQRLVAKGIDEAEFMAAFADELEEAQIQAAAKLQEQLYTQAVNGNTAAMLHLAKQQQGQSISSIASTSEVCAWLGIGKVALHDMRKRGIITPTGRDRWDLKKTVRAACVHLREVAAGRRGESDDDAPDLVVERAKLARAQREAVEMENDVTRGMLMKREDVFTILAAIFGEMIRELETLSDRAERDLRIKPELVEYIRTAIRETREAMSRKINGLRPNL